MRTILAELETMLAAFVERDLPGTFIVGCSDVEALHVAQVLTRLDERSESDVFLSFTESASTAADFVDSVVRNLALQQAGLAEQLGPNAMLPDLPPLARATSAPPSARIKALIRHVLGLLPSGDHRLVLSLLPIELPPDFSTELVEPLLRAEHDPRVRLVLRDDRAKPASLALARSWPDEHVLAYSFDLSAGDAVAATAAATHDQERPPAARIQALMELAYLDLGHRRLADAEQKFRGSAKFYALTQDAPLEALALAGVAEVERARADLIAARRTYETALLTVAVTQAFPVTLQITIALADTWVALETFADAEGYYRLADALADKLLRPHTRADVQESIGVCRKAQRADLEAAQLWTTAAELCRAIDYPKRLHSLLGRLAAHHDSLSRDRARRRACLEEQAAVHARLKGACSC